MARADLVIHAGQHLISFPLDMRGASYENDPRILFDPTLKDYDVEPDENGNRPYMYERLITQGFIMYNSDGVWYGNLAELHPSKSYWLSVSNAPDPNSPNNTVKVTLTLNGDVLTPHTFSYDLLDGVNWVSYLFQVLQVLLQQILMVIEHFTSLTMLEMIWSCSHLHILL